MIFEKLTCRNEYLNFSVVGERGARDPSQFIEKYENDWKTNQNNRSTERKTKALGTFGHFLKMLTPPEKELDGKSTSTTPRIWFPQTDLK